MISRPLQEEHSPLKFTCVGNYPTNTGEQININIKSIECCGWLEVSCLGKIYSSYRHEQLKVLFDNGVKINSYWAKTHEQTIMPTCFINLIEEKGQQEAWEKHILALGFEYKYSFYNPNTGHTVRHYLRPFVKIE